MILVSDRISAVDLKHTEVRSGLFRTIAGVVGVVAVTLLGALGAKFLDNNKK